MGDILIGQGCDVRFSDDDFAVDDQQVTRIETITLPDSAADDVEHRDINKDFIDKVHSRQSDLGQVSLEHAHDPDDTVHTLLSSLQESGNSRKWRIDVQPTTEAGTVRRLEFNGHVQAMNGSSFGAADRTMKTAVITLTSKPVWSTPP